MFARATTLLAHVGRGIRRLVDPIPPTPLGLLTVVVCWLGLTELAYGQMDVVVLVIGWVALGLAGLAVVSVVPVALWLKLKKRVADRVEPLRTETGRPTRTGLAVPTFGWLPLVQVRWGWDRPPAVTVRPTRLRFGVLGEEIVVPDRGEIRGVRRRFVVQDAFGLARVGLRKDDPLVVEVLPAAGGLRQMPILTSLSGGDDLPHPMGLADGDRVELRRYVPGDSARFIHWKIFGKTRTLMVRTPERALMRSRRTVAYQIAGVGDDATAACARVAVEHDAFAGEWVFRADGATHDTDSAEEALRQIIRSSEARDRGGSGLAAFVDTAERSGPASLVVFAPPTPGPWLSAVVAVARGRSRTRVVIGVDGLAPVSAPGWITRLLTRAPKTKISSVEDLDRVVRALADARCDVLIFDRPSGRQLGGAHRRAAALGEAA
jgi:hypothetical protein